jgi:hypothetical protein
LVLGCDGSQVSRAAPFCRFVAAPVLDEATFDFSPTGLRYLLRVPLAQIERSAKEPIAAARLLLAEYLGTSRCLEALDFGGEVLAVADERVTFAHIVECAMQLFTVTLGEPTGSLARPKTFSTSSSD